MNWLARLEVDARALRPSITAGNMYSWHKLLWECYPNQPDVGRDFLTRIEPLDGSFLLWTLSKRQPIRPAWCPPEGFQVKEIASSFLSHRYYVFDVIVNPVKSIILRDESGLPVCGADGKRKRGKRIPIVAQEDLRNWLARKGVVRCLDQADGAEVPGGFRLLEGAPLEISPMVRNHFRKHAHTGYHGGVRFRGTLKVTNAEAFAETYQAGLGHAKGFGFGLLLLAPTSLV